MNIRLRDWFLLTVICGSSFLMLINFGNFDIFNSNEEALGTTQDDTYHTPGFDESFLIKTKGCTIPFLKYLDKNTEKIVQYPSTVKPCRNRSKALLESNKHQIWVKTEHAYFYGIKKMSKLVCCYRSFYRPTSIADINSPEVDQRVTYNACINFTSSIKVNDEFVRVTCAYYHKTVYEQFYLFATNKTLLIRDDSIPEMKANESTYNVLILGVDAVSRLNLFRTMPKTVSFIKNSGGIDFAGYNKVGDNTFPNVVPLLMGIKETELKQTCIPHTWANFDNCPFVWEWFKQAGYYTALAEDSALLGTFNYVKQGFSSTPTDYYIHTFISEAERNVGSKINLNTYVCMNDKYFYKVLLDYIVDLTTTLKYNRLFGFFWEATMSHDYLNHPMLMDDSFFKLFMNLNASNYLNETIFFFISDHGIRWGPIRETKQGRLEERLPFLFVLVPTSFRETYTLAYHNLKQNTKRLTSPYDVHETLNDLVNMSNIRDDVIQARSKKPYAQSRGISLFLPIPTNRTCEMAGIDDHWCTCHKGTALPKDSLESVEVGNQLIINLNAMLQNHSQCSRLNLAEILDIKEMVSGIPDKDEVSWKEYMVSVKTTPGGGIFEATLRYDGKEWTLAGTVSRLNLYGVQSRCIHDYRLKLYCYCV